MWAIRFSTREPQISGTDRQTDGQLCTSHARHLPPPRPALPAIAVISARAPHSPYYINTVTSVCHRTAALVSTAGYGSCSLFPTNTIIDETYILLVRFFCDGCRWSAWLVQTMLLCYHAGGFDTPGDLLLHRIISALISGSVNRFVSLEIKMPANYYFDLVFKYFN